MSHPTHWGLFVPTCWTLFFFFFFFKPGPRGRREAGARRGGHLVVRAGPGRAGTSAN